MSSMSYEDACALQEWLWSPERLREAINSPGGINALRVENRKRLEATGWTSAGLCNEAFRRMRERIEELKSKEGW